MPGITHVEWQLLHIGNIFVRGSSPSREETGLENAEVASDLDVCISFGGENPNWCNNLDVDFAAIAPLRLSWHIEREVMIGHLKGDALARGEGQVLETVVEDGDQGVLAAQSGVSPLSRLPRSVVELVLEFSQPTLVPPHEHEEENEHVLGDDDDGDNNSSWVVF